MVEWDFLSMEDEEFLESIDELSEDKKNSIVGYITNKLKVHQDTRTKLDLIEFRLFKYWWENGRKDPNIAITASGARNIATYVLEQLQDWHTKKDCEVALRMFEPAHITKYGREKLKEDGFLSPEQVKEKLNVFKEQIVFLYKGEPNEIRVINETIDEVFGVNNTNDGNVKTDYNTVCDKQTLLSTKQRNIMSENDWEKIATRAGWHSKEACLAEHTGILQDIPKHEPVHFGVFIHKPCGTKLKSGAEIKKHVRTCK